MNFLRQDLTYAIRQLRKSYGFTLAVILTLALGIGANLTVFLIFYGVLLRPLPFPQPQQLVRFYRAFPNGNRGDAFTATQFLFVKHSARTLQTAAAYDYIPTNVNLVQGGEAVPLKALRVSEDFFRVFQMEPELGRGFNAADMVANSAGVAVISDALWHQRFAADPQILGRAITIGNHPYSVIGVASPRFQLDTPVDIWSPLSLVENATDQGHNFQVVGRLLPNATYAQATDDLKRVLLQFKDAYPKLWDQYESIALVDYHDSLVGNIRPSLEILMGAVALLLAIVVANILSLLLTRSIGRRREMSLRSALGASGWRLLRQMLAENFLLSTAGGIAGLLLAYFATPALLRLSPLELPQFSSLQIGAPAIGVAVLLTIGCALLFSGVPAMEARRTQLNQSLRVNTTQIAVGRNLAQKALVVSEVALSLVLLVGAALLLTSFWKLLHTPAGFATQNVLTFKTAFAENQVATTAAYGQRVDDLLGRLEAIPGVASAAAVNNLPTQLVPDLSFDIIGRDPKRSDASGDYKYMPVSAHYFDALQIPVQAGRAINPGDTPGSTPVVVINQEFARTFFKGESAIGQHIRIGAGNGPGFEDPIREIVGVVADVKQEGLDKAAPGVMYLPQLQIPDALTQMDNGLLGTSWIIRSKADSVDVAAQARRIFMDNAHTPLLSVAPLSEVVSASVAQQRFSMLLLSGFGLISLALGTAGLYGVMSYTVARRTKEIGVRMAVGAQRGSILQLVLREALTLVAIGLAGGIAVSLAGAKLLQSLVFGLSPRDPLTLALASAVLLVTGLLAALIPARRAAAIEPMQALRAE
jgi:predicted permease